MSEQSSSLDYLRELQSNYEKRFNCIVCMEAKLHMVYGLCQHRLCADCLYFGNRSLRPKMDKCPVCLMPCAFPASRPDIPEDNIDMQRCLGVRVCPNSVKGCLVEMWEWEIEEHRGVCQFEKMNLANIPCAVMAKSCGARTKAKSSKKQSTQKTRGKANSTVKHQAQRRSPRLWRP